MTDEPPRKPPLSRPTPAGRDRPRQARHRREADLPPLLDELDERRRALEQIVNPTGQNLHFGPKVRTDPATLDALCDIGSQAWHAIENEPSWDASFWFYGWFLLVANVTLQIWRDSSQAAYPRDLVTRLALLIVDISQMTMKPEYQGDIQKRLYEALAHVLLAFGRAYDLWGTVTTRAADTGNEDVIKIVNIAIDAARRLDREPH